MVEEAVNRFSWQEEEGEKKSVKEHLEGGWASKVLDWMKEHTSEFTVLGGIVVGDTLLKAFSGASVIDATQDLVMGAGSLAFDGVDSAVDWVDDAFDAARSP